MPVLLRIKFLICLIALPFISADLGEELSAAPPLKNQLSNSSGSEKSAVELAIKRGLLKNLMTALPTTSLAEYQESITPRQWIFISGCPIEGLKMGLSII